MRRSAQPIGPDASSASNLAAEIAIKYRMHVSSLVVALFIGLLGAGFAFYIRPYLERRAPTRQATASELAAVTANEVPAGQAVLYVFRPPMPGDKPYEVKLDGTPIAKLKGNSYLRLAIQPGTHSLIAGPGGIAGLAQAAGNLAFTALAGENIILSAHPGTGGAARNTVQVANELNHAEAMNAMATMRRVDL